MRNPTPAADSQPAMTPATATVPATGPATPPPRAARHGHWQRENPRLPDRERYRRSTPRPRPRKGHRPAPMHRRAATQPLHNRSEEHTSELQSLMRNSYAVFCLKKKKQKQDIT